MNSFAQHSDKPATPPNPNIIIRLEPKERLKKYDDVQSAPNFYSTGSSLTAGAIRKE